MDADLQAQSDEIAGSEACQELGPFDALVHVDVSWGNVSVVDLMADFFRPLRETIGFRTLYLAGNVPKGVGGDGITVLGRMNEAEAVSVIQARGCMMLVRIWRWGRFRIPLTKMVVEETLHAYGAHASEGWMQTDFNDLPCPYFRVEILGRQALQALDGGLAFDWEAARIDGVDFAVERRNLGHGERIEYLQHGFLDFFEFPKFVALEASRLCNLRCTMCVTHSDFIDHSYLEKYPKHMDMERFRVIVDQLAPYADFVSISPQYQGEPLLSPDFMDMLAYSKERGLWVGFTSNATLWSQQFIDRVIDLGVNNIKISIDGASAKSFESVRIGADYAGIVRNVDRLIETRCARRSRTPYISMSMTLLAANRHEKGAFLSQWLEKADAVTFNNVCINDVVPEKFFEPERYPCPSLWEGCHVLTNGDVVACCRDVRAEEVMGNAFETPLMDIWKNEKYERFRQLHMEKKWDQIGICARCDTWMGKTTEVEGAVGGSVRRTPFTEEVRAQKSQASRHFGKLHQWGARIRSRLFATDRAV